MGLTLPNNDRPIVTTDMVSTPNTPDGHFASIENDPNSKYEKIVLSYEAGLDKIYDRTEIEKKKLEPEFPREYECKYLGRMWVVWVVWATYSLHNKLISA